MQRGISETPNLALAAGKPGFSRGKGHGHPCAYTTDISESLRWGLSGMDVCEVGRGTTRSRKWRVIKNNNNNNNNNNNLSSAGLERANTT